MPNWSLELHDKVAVLTFTRPPRNLMDMASMTELVAHLESLATRTDEATVVMRVGSERAHMGQPEVAIGIIPGGGGTQRLPRLVGSALGAELCLSGRIVDAHEAKRIGLLNEVLPTEGFVQHAIEWCARIARHP